MQKSTHKSIYEPDPTTNANHKVTIISVGFVASISGIECDSLMIYSFVLSQNARLHIGMMIVANSRFRISPTKLRTMNGNIHAGRFYMNKKNNNIFQQKETHICFAIL